MEVLSTIGITGLIIGAIAWLIRSIINQILSQDIELFKANLQRDSQQELIRLQSSLQLVQFEHQVRFSKLHERQAEIIAEVYGRLVQLHMAADYFVMSWLGSENDEKNDRADHLMDVFSKFIDYFDKHRIYLNEETCSEIDGLRSAISNACTTLMVYIKNPIIAETSNHVYEAWKSANDIMKNDVPTIKKSLEENFRNILGVLQICKGINT